MIITLFHMKETDIIVGWFKGEIPNKWFVGAPELLVDRDEILVMGTLEEPRFEENDTPEVRHEALTSRISGFREDTRTERMAIARRAEKQFQHKVSWGARCGEHEAVFTTLASPAMTRLRMSERRVLDTLVDVGAARSRSDALAWCVKLVGQHQESWLAELRDALRQVEEIRGRGPV
jgi:hypothetical protein